MNFRFAVTNQAPLRLQLSAVNNTAKLPALVAGPFIKLISANCGTVGSSIGATTEPVLIRPYILGTGNNQSVSNGISFATATVLTNPYVTLPSDPDPLTLTACQTVLVRRNFSFPTNSEMIIAPSGAVLFFANASDQSTDRAARDFNSWDGELVWEEF